MDLQAQHVKMVHGIIGLDPVKVRKLAFYLSFSELNSIDSENPVKVRKLAFYLSFSELNSIDSIEFVENYFSLCLENENY